MGESIGLDWWIVLLIGIAAIAVIALIILSVILIVSARKRRDKARDKEEFEKINVASGFALCEQESTPQNIVDLKYEEESDEAVEEEELPEEIEEEELEETVEELLEEEPEIIDEEESVEIEEDSQIPDEEEAEAEEPIEKAAEEFSKSPEKSEVIGTEMMENEKISDEPIAEEAENDTVKTAEIDEKQKTEAAPAPIVPIILTDDTVGAENAIPVRYRSSFTSRLIQAGNEIQDYYTALKNQLFSYKGIKSRTSWNYENFSKGRVQCARINLKGKTLIINLALAPSSYNATKYHFTDMSDNPKFDKLPMLLKIKSQRALKYAIELIDELMKSLDIPQGSIPTVDYRMPFEPNSALAKRGLVKMILPAGVKIDANTVLLEDNSVDSIIGSSK